MWWELPLLAALSWLMYYQIGAIGRDFKRLLRPTPPVLGGGAVGEANIDRLTRRVQRVWVGCVVAWGATTLVSWLLFQTGALPRDFFAAALQSAEDALMDMDARLAGDRPVYAHLRRFAAAQRGALVEAAGQCVSVPRCWMAGLRAWTVLVVGLCALAFDLAAHVLTAPCRLLLGECAVPSMAATTAVLTAAEL